MKFDRSLDWLKEANEENLLGDDELDSVKPDINEADKETYTDDNGVERYVGNHKAVDKTTKSEPQKKQEPKSYEPSKEVVNLSSTIRDDIMSTVDQFEKEGKKYSLKQLMQKKLSGYSDKLASDDDKKYINGAAKYLYRLMTDRQPNFDFSL